MSTDPIRALILSGGGGRGAFHAGVYKYLMKNHKGNVDSNHAGAWEPQIIVGTSIGAVNGVAIAQGMSADELVEVWKSLEEKDIQGLPPGMRGIARWAARAIFKEVMDAKLPQISPKEATSPIPKEYWPPLPLLPRWLAERLVGRWINLLDTGPLRKTLFTRFGLNEEKLASRDAKALLIAATKVRTGERLLFSNREVEDQKRGVPRNDVITKITADRILASCSIPLVYPWTWDSETESFYWDGALVANTPLGAALDMMKEDINIPAEVVVVMMTPWWESDKSAPVKSQTVPKSFGDAITWMLDWMLLASFRENLKMIRAFNELAVSERKGNPPYRYRIVTPIIVSPLEFLQAERIIDYDGDVSAKLIDEGYRAAKHAFEKEFKIEKDRKIKS